MLTGCLPAESGIEFNENLVPRTTTVKVIYEAFGIRQLNFKKICENYHLDDCVICVF
jgi:hypothetical protein